MISPDTSVLTDLLWFVLFWIPLGVVLWLISLVFEDIRKGRSDWKTKQRHLRWQRFLLRGRYFAGGTGFGKKARNLLVFRTMRYFVLAVWFALFATICIKIIEELQ